MSGQPNPRPKPSMAPHLWSWWNSEGKGIQDQEKDIETEESHTDDAKQISWEKKPWKANYEMQLALVSGKKDYENESEDEYAYPPPKTSRRGWGGKAGWMPAFADDKQQRFMVEVEHLRYSQESCLEFFQCGRSVWDLVEDLLNKKVSLSKPFLRLTVFETKEHSKRILRCINNRRLLALKTYAEVSGQDSLMVHINLYSHKTLKDVRSFMRNSDHTDGKDVRVRVRHEMFKQKNRNKWWR